MRGLPAMMTAALIALATLAGTPALAQTPGAAALAGLLPAAPMGWTAADGDEFESQGVGLEVAQASRTYTVPPVRPSSSPSSARPRW